MAQRHPYTPSERTPLILAEEDTPVQSREQTATSASHTETSHVVDEHIPKQPKNIAPSLQNSGNVARDHLASERTFLAYVRTSLAIAGAGVALAQILSFTEFYTEDDHSRRVEVYARPLGAAAVVLALLVLSIGLVRYFSIQQALVKGRFPVARVGVVLTAALLGALVVAAFGVLTHSRVG